MDKDGTKNGFDNELISEVSKNVNIPIIASGGVGSLEHFLQGVLLVMQMLYSLQVYFIINFINKRS